MKSSKCGYDSGNQKVCGTCRKAGGGGRSPRRKARREDLENPSDRLPSSKRSPFLVTVFEASTAHITSKDDGLLKEDGNRGGLVVYRYEFGCFVFVDGVPGARERKALLSCGFSEAFCGLLEVAGMNGCKFLQLDCDGEVYSDLPVFDW